MSFSQEKRKFEIICEDLSHIFTLDVGGDPFLGGQEFTVAMENFVLNKIKNNATKFEVTMNYLEMIKKDINLNNNSLFDQITFNLS